HPALTRARADALRGRLLDERHYHHDRVVGGGDADVVDSNGAPVLYLRHRAVNRPFLGPGVLAALRPAATPSKNQGDLPSGIIGYYDRGRSWPYCRCCPFTRDRPDLWAVLLPLLVETDRLYKVVAPGPYAAQQRYAALCHPDFMIRGTVFSTVTVNR